MLTCPKQLSTVNFVYFEKKFVKNYEFARYGFLNNSDVINAFFQSFNLQKLINGL